MSLPTTESFLKDVATHQMIVLRDDGLYRHVQFRRPDTISMGFDLITIPGKLIYTGDMGTYVFQRLPDMFEFFRTDRRELGSLRINLDYWSEKLIATACYGRHGGAPEEFCPEAFKQVVVRLVRESCRAGRADLLREVRERVLSHADDDRTGHSAYSAIMGGDL